MSLFITAGKLVSAPRAQGPSLHIEFTFGCPTRRRLKCEDSQRPQPAEQLAAVKGLLERELGQTYPG